MKPTIDDVREVLEKCNADVSGLRVNEDCICFCYGRLDYEIDSTSVRYKVLGSEDWTSHTHKLFKRNWHYAKIDKAIAELIALLSQQPTLKEQVEEILKPHEEIRIIHIRDDEVCVQNGYRLYWVTATHVYYEGNESTIDEYVMELGRYGGVFKPISELLTPAESLEALCPSEPHSATARGIEELKAEHERILAEKDESIEFANQRCDELRAKVTELEDSVRDLNAENESMRNCFGSADEAGQAVGDLVHKLEKNVSKQADLKDEETELHISLMTAIAREQIAGNALEQS